MTVQAPRGRAGGPPRWLWRGGSSPSLRARLTLWYGGMFFLAGLVILAVTYLLVKDSLEHNDSKPLRAGVAAVGPTPDKLLTLDPTADPNRQVQFTNPFTGATSTMAYRDVPKAFNAAITNFQKEVQRAEEHRRNQALQGLLRRSGAAIGLIGLGAVGLGWLMAGRVLRPINDITATARRVAASSGRGLHERIALDGPADELKELADTFDDMLERLDESFAGQRRFVDNASHELRTPLAINRTVLEVALADPEASAYTKQLARTLLATNDRSQQLIEGLLLLARSDNELVEHKQVDLAEVGAHVVGLLAEEARSAGIDVRHRFDAAPVDGDPVLLERLMQNLVQNGIRHNEPHGWVQVTTGPEGLVVTNSGPIVPSYEVESLFEPFRRLEEERTTGSRGIGLGLSIVRSIVRAHHGEITTEPRSAGGLTLRVRLRGIMQSDRARCWPRPQASVAATPVRRRSPSHPRPTVSLRPYHPLPVSGLDSYDARLPRRGLAGFARPRTRFTIGFLAPGGVGRARGRSGDVHLLAATRKAREVTVAIDYRLSQLEILESEAIHVIREVGAEFERPALLFSGGKDSAVLLHIAVKAFWPAPIPFPLLHVDTGHNFPEVLEYRDRRAEEVGARVVVASVERAISAGRLAESRDPAGRNRLQTPVLLEAIEEYGFDALFGGARRDEEKARAKERFLSFRDEFGQWDPKNQRPELWDLYNARIQHGEHIRVFPLSNWTELDVWQYIEREAVALPSIYFAHRREVVDRGGMLLAVGSYVRPKHGEAVATELVRFRTVGDMSCTGAVLSSAESVAQVIREIAATRITERGATRADDRTSEAAMEDRKREGYF